MAKKKQTEQSSGGTNDAEAITAPDTSTSPESPAASIVDGLLERQPEPNPAIQEKLRSEANIEVVTDSSGATYDPTQHSTGSDGRPVFRADGTFRARRKAGSSKVVVPSGDSGAATSSPEANAVDSASQQAYATGAAIASMITGVCWQLMGDEWAPVKTKQMDEHLYLQQITGEYCKSQGMTEISPGWALAIGWSGYFVKRFTMPVTKSRLTKLKEWAVGKYANWRLRKQNAKAKNLKVEIPDE